MELKETHFKETLQILRTLRSSIKENEDEIHFCVKGEILREYLIANDIASEKLQSIQNRLLQLQERQRRSEL